MAEGGGFENPAYDPDYPEVPGNDDDDDEYEQDHDETTPFLPDSASTPGPGGEEIPMQTMHHEKGGLPDTSYDEIPSLGSFVHQDDKPVMLERAKEFIKRKFPRVDFARLGPIGFSKKKVETRQQLYHLVQKVVRLKFSKKMGGVFSKKSQTSSKHPLGPKLNL